MPRFGIVSAVIGWYLALGAPAALAQGTSGIAGTVKDPSGAVLPGVTIEAASPALIERVRTVVTDGTGQYKIVELRPGSYTVTFTLPGFSTVKREGIELTSGFTAVVNADLAVGQVAETITVSGSSPVVDVQNVSQQQVMTRDVIDAVPTAKNFANLGVLIPGIYVTGLGRAQDVGGTEGDANQSLAIHGGRQFDQMFVVDGMSVGALEGVNGGVVWMAYPDGNVEEINLAVGAYSAESESGGVGINIIPKSGGNIFKGTMSGSYTNQHLQSNNLNADLRSRGLTAANRVNYLSDINPSIGGPLVKNRLWFYGGYRNWRTVRFSTVYPDTDRTDWVYVPDRSQGPEPDDQLTWNVSGRLTWQASQKHKISANLNYDDRCDCHTFAGILEPLTTPDAGVVANYPTKIAQATWTAPLTNRLLFEAGVSAVITHLDETEHPEAIGPPALELASGLGFRSRGAQASGSLNEGYPLLRGRNYTVRWAASYVTGAHAFKTGLTLNPGRVTTDRHILGDYLVVLLNGVPNRVEYSPMPYSTIERQRKAAAFVQDRWTVHRLTLNGGLRLDLFRTSYPDVRLAATNLLPARQFPAQDVLNWKDLSPRLGASYDLFGNGKTALKGSFSRYVLLESTALTRAVHPAVTSGGRLVRGWTDTNQNFVPEGNPLNPLTNGELGPSTNVNFGSPVVTLRYDPGWTDGWNSRTYNWEASAAIQHELLPRMSLNASYVRRWYGNLTVVNNLAALPSEYDPFCITAPTDSRLPNGGGQQICGLYDVQPAKVGALNRLQSLASNYGNQFEYWQGMDLTANARLQNGLILQGGMSSGRTITDNCDVVPKIGNPSLLYCHRDSPFLTQVKALGAYTLPGEVQIAATFQSIPGNQIQANYVATNAQIAPSLGRNLAAGPNGTVTVNVVRPGTLFSDRANQFDVRIARTFKLSGSRLKGMLDIYNLFNRNPVLGLNNTYGINGASWLVPTQIMAGRLVKFGAQLDF